MWTASSIASCSSAFPLDVLPREVLADWAALSSDLPGEGERVTGTFETELGDAHYRVRRVVLGDHTGAFVVAILPAAELDEIEDLQTVRRRGHRSSCS